MSFREFLAAVALGLIAGAVVPFAEPYVSDLWAQMTAPVTLSCGFIELAGFCVISALVVRIGGKS